VRESRGTTESDVPQSRCGFVAVVGRPNSGKSSLINAVLEEQLCVVTSLPQTTRRNLRGVYTREDLQLIFVDTPGMHQGRHSFNAAMAREAGSVLDRQRADVVVYIVDLSREYGEEEDLVAAAVARAAAPSVIVFNKIDLCSDTDARVSRFFDRYEPVRGRPHIRLCATAPSAKDMLLDLVVPLVPVGPKLFPEEDLTDSPLRFFAAEYLQKGIVLATRDEVPHASIVEILDYRELPGRHDIDAVIHVETRGQRGILIGKGGAMLGRIRSLAESEMSRMAGVPVSYHCHVTVTPKWRDDPRFLGRMGYQPG
jgi:GTP-binding protein Era